MDESELNCDNGDQYYTRHWTVTDANSGQVVECDQFFARIGNANFNSPNHVLIDWGIGLVIFVTDCIYHSIHYIQKVLEHKPSHKCSYPSYFLQNSLLASFLVDLGAGGTSEALTEIINKKKTLSCVHIQ